MDIDIGTDQPRPDCPLVIGTIALSTITAEMSLIGRVGGTQRAQAHWCEQVVRHLMQHTPSLSIGEQVASQRSCEQLIGPQRGIVLTYYPLNIHHVVQTAAGLIPETGIEVLLYQGAELTVLGRIGRETGRPGFHVGEHTVPESVYFYRLAMARRDDPIIDLGIHPG